MTMPALRAGRGQRGMTLIEILVVVLIIAIVASLAVLSVGALGGDRELDDEINRLADGIALVQEQAQLEARDYGLRIESSRYEFMRFDGFEQAWRMVDDDPGLQPRELPAGLAFELFLEGRPVLLRQVQRADAKLPQLFAWGSGEMTPYRLAIARKDASRITLIGAPEGTIEIERDAPP